MITAEALRKIVGNDWVVTGKEQTEPYKVDATPPAVMPKAAENIIVVKPATAEEVSLIMKLANQEKTPVYVRGGGTGMAGGAIPTLDGVVIAAPSRRWTVWSSRWRDSTRSRRSTRTV